MAVGGFKNNNRTREDIRGQEINSLATAQLSHLGQEDKKNQLKNIFFYFI